MSNSVEKRIKVKNIEQIRASFEQLAVEVTGHRPILVGDRYKDFTHKCMWESMILGTMIFSEEEDGEEAVYDILRFFEKMPEKKWFCLEELSMGIGGNYFSQLNEVKQYWQKLGVINQNEQR